jgi:muramoyltetrapeptide carboxypeptidase
MQVIKPARLKKGDTIGLISPASSPDELNRIEESTNYLERLGYRVESMLENLMVILLEVMMKD